MSRPSKTIWPEVGAKVPVSRLKSVVLPAPFGPMMECSEPDSMPRLTPFTAVSAPNDLVMFLVSKSIDLERQAVPRLDHAAPEEHHHHHEGEAEQERPARPQGGGAGGAGPAPPGVPPQSRNQKKEEGADDRAVERARAADQRGEHHVA